MAGDDDHKRRGDDGEGLSEEQIQLATPILRVTGEKGILACGWVEISHKMGDVYTVVTGVRTHDEMLNTGTMRFSHAAEKRGVRKGRTGRAVAYVPDVILNDDNTRKIIASAGGSECLFIEAPFIEEDAGKAVLKFHLTARQAGDMAKKAGVKGLILFHVSPKYKGSGHLLVREAMRALVGTTHRTTLRRTVI
jgi:uncharacterized protein YunC (DUF1805 family)